VVRRGGIPLLDFSGGEAAVFGTLGMPTKFSYILQNCHVSDRRGIAKVPGYKRVNNNVLTYTLPSGYEFVKKDGTKILLAAGGGSIYKLDANKNLVSIQTGWDANAKVSFATMNDLCLMCNGVDAPIKYDGTTVSALGGGVPVTAFKFHVHKGRVWAIERANKLLASHSALNIPGDWTTANDAGYIDFQFLLQKGDELLDVATFVNFIVYFFRNHIAVYSGTTPSGTGSNFSLVQLIEGTGVVGTGTVGAIGNDLAYLDDTGVKSLQQVATTGNLNTGNISVAIDPFIQAEIRDNTTGLYGAAHYPDLSWFVLQIKNRLRIFNYKMKSWSRIVGADVAGIFSTSDRKMYLCGSGKLYEYGKGWAFDTKTIPMFWITGWLTVGKGGQNYYPKFLEIDNYMGPNIEMNYGARYDLNVSNDETADSFTTELVPSLMDELLPDILDNAFYLDQATHEPVRVPLFGGGKSMQLFFYNNGNQGPIEISSLILQGKLGGF
jgi:hypothetical protein